MIKCRVYENTSCLRCRAVKKEMVLIGAFAMCRPCWKDEFGIEEIDTDSKLYIDKYLKWYKIYSAVYSK